MTAKLRERFGPAGTPPPAFLTGDFRLVPANYPSWRDYRVEHDSVNVLEQPLAVDRRYHLSHGSDSLQLDLALCLDGPAAAVGLLFHRLEAFQRQPSPEEVHPLNAAQGDAGVGVAWAWGTEDRNGVVGLVRHNVAVLLQGRYGTLLEQAHQLDRAIASVSVSPAPAMSEAVLFDLQNPDLKVAAGGHLELGGSIRSGEQLFFLSTGGSVNRDALNPTRYYYRAGLSRGTHQVTILSVGVGLLPTRQTLRIAVE